MTLTRTQQRKGRLDVSIIVSPRKCQVQCFQTHDCATYVRREAVTLRRIQHWKRRLDVCIMWFTAEVPGATLANP